ncbi:hypothetical protein [Streptomyces sp. NBC_00996]|uniref:hypothetical protein n=1 Tax=Streptomyces sp. NBC_00996 TaxID=2903710 RepID=UPI00387059E8|nr:hypothetical protein OG390_01065 [Streptomyces sp. NBC_00996]
MLDHATPPHDDDLVRDLLGDRQVMGDEHVRHGELLAQIREGAAPRVNLSMAFRPHARGHEAMAGLAEDHL